MPQFDKCQMDVLLTGLLAAGKALEAFALVLLALGQAMMDAGLLPQEE